MPRRPDTDPDGHLLPRSGWWTPERLGVVAAIAVVVIGLGALVGYKTSGGGDSSGGTVSSTAAELEANYTSGVDWQDCAGGYDCANIQAPLDWSKASTGSISLALIKHPAKGTPEGAIVVNPGGPGDSGVDLVGGDVDDAVDPALAKRFDVIGFDPRGVGESSAVKCYDAKKTDGFLYGILPGAVGSSAWIAASKHADSAYAEACARSTGPLLAHVDATSVAHDLDLIRADLGEKKLDYLGYSYGTYLGTIYAGLYPDRVGHFVLDGADDPWSDSGSSDSGSSGGGSGSSSGGSDGSDGSGADGGYDDSSTVAQAVGFEDDLRAYVAACLAGSKDALGKAACPFTGTTAEGMKQISALLGRVRASPLIAKDGRRLGDTALATGISDALYDTSEWSDLTKAFTEVQAGNPAKALSLADEYNDRDSDGTYYDNANDDFNAVNCLEGSGQVSESDMRHEAADLKKSAPVLGIYDAYGELLCNAWTVAPVAFPDPVTAPSAGPILVIGSTGDPATPYGDAVALTKQLKTAHLLTRVGEGHTAYDLGDTCIDSAVDSFVTAGTIPTGSAARCQ